MGKWDTADVNFEGVMGRGIVSSFISALSLLIASGLNCFGVKMLFIFLTPHPQIRTNPGWGDMWTLKGAWSPGEKIYDATIMEIRFVC